MPTIEISQRAYDALKLETERFNREEFRFRADHPAEQRGRPATMGALASDYLINQCERDDAAEDEDEPIPF